MATYRLTWSGTGVLDLSQVLDTRGRPIVLSAQQPVISIPESVLKNPYIQRYLGGDLTAELIDGPKPTEPASPPIITPAIAPVVTPVTAPVMVPIETLSVNDVPPFPSDLGNTVLTKETLTLSNDVSSASPPVPSTPTSSALDTDDESKVELKGGFKGRKSSRR